MCIFVGVVKTLIHSVLQLSIYLIFNFFNAYGSKI